MRESRVRLGDPPRLRLLHRVLHSGRFSWTAQKNVAWQQPQENSQRISPRAMQLAQCFEFDGSSTAHIE
jgi:hypothetical protein